MNQTETARDWLLQYQDQRPNMIYISSRLTCVFASIEEASNDKIVWEVLIVLSYYYISIVI